MRVHEKFEQRLDREDQNTTEEFIGISLLLVCLSTMIFLLVQVSL